jgi:hypothetical protein
MGSCACGSTRDFVSSKTDWLMSRKESGLTRRSMRLPTSIYLFIENGGDEKINRRKRYEEKGSRGLS